MMSALAARAVDTFHVSSIAFHDDPELGEIGVEMSAVSGLPDRVVLGGRR
jgi:hypothetical protein